MVGKLTPPKKHGILIGNIWFNCCGTKSGTPMFPTLAPLLYNCEGYALADLSLWTSNWLEQLTSSICSLNIVEAAFRIQPYMLSLHFMLASWRNSYLFYLDVSCETAATVLYPSGIYSTNYSKNIKQLGHRSLVAPCDAHTITLSRATP